MPSFFDNLYDVTSNVEAVNVVVDNWFFLVQNTVNEMHYVVVNMSLWELFVDSVYIGKFGLCRFFKYRFSSRSGRVAFAEFGTVDF